MQAIYTILHANLLINIYIIFSLVQGGKSVNSHELSSYIVSLILKAACLLSPKNKSWCLKKVCSQSLMVGKSQPRHPEIIDIKIVKLEETIVQMLTWCLKKVCSQSLGKLSIRDQAGW